MTPNPLKSRHPGLGLLPPAIRLVLVFLFSVFYIFVNDLGLAALVLLTGVLIFFCSCWKNWKLSLAAIFPGVMLLVYNLILSPPEAGGVQWAVFTVNQAGLERGLVTGMRLVGVMLISFAWLAVTPIPEMYTSLAWIRPIRAWVLELLRGVQIVKREFIALTQSLIIRGLKWDSPLANIKNLVPLAMAIIPRVADNAQKTTFAMQSHQPSKGMETLPKEGDGIRVSEATVRYSPRLPDVLRQVDFRLDPGEFVYLAGADMAGKTTLLRLSGGVIPRIMGEYKGRVLVDGHVTHEIPLSALCHVARYVAPDPFSSIYGLTVGQEISFLAPDETTARHYLDVMGIESLWDRETTKLSGGQQVRLVLAGALASQARYLLLDSPMQELDPEGRLDFMQALQALHAQSEVAVVVSDPFWRQLLPFTQRVVVLENGQTAAALTPQEFFDTPWLDRCNLVTSLAQPVRRPLGEVIAGLENVHVSLENNPILHGIDLHIRQGELLAIMGPNGSGKTTAMLTLAGAIRPSQGRVYTKGRLAYVFQDARLQAVADTVRGELALGTNILQWPPEKSELFIQQGLQWTGIDPDSSPIDLHPSQARMLAIAACNTESAALILDEPTVGLDSLGVQKLMGMVNRLLAEGKGVIVITHDEAIAGLANRVLVIRDGLVAEERNNPD
jgi:energy-coupling factor transport system ATP-binding protein